MIVLDTSALVKRYLDEPGHEVVRSLTGPLAASVLVGVEMISALWRARRDECLDTSAVQPLVATVEADLARGVEDPEGVALISVTSPLLDTAARMVARHGVAALDAIHVATVITLRDEIAPITGFACFDHRLREAASIEGVVLVPSVLTV